jgi:hypothetical protein
MNERRRFDSLVRPQRGLTRVDSPDGAGYLQYVA